MSKQLADLGNPVSFQRQGRIGRITLDRPKALNALTMDMLRSIDVALETWRDDPTIHLIVIDSSSGRAFCAGGDIRTVRDWVVGGRFDAVDAFFVLEYALNRAIARYPKPYLSLIDGICMGGGVGLAVHGGVRVATEHALFAMPEAQIGLFPDVGASYFLPRLRGALGIYLGLTGAKFGTGDACWLGLATHYVPRSALSSMLDELSESGIGALSQFAQQPPTPGLKADQDAIDGVFRENSVTSIMQRLAELDDARSREALGAMQAASPSALRWTFDLIRAGADRTLEECQRAELLLTRRACRHPDFAEGVRAAVIDKDRKPNWQQLDE